MGSRRDIPRAGHEVWVMAAFVVLAFVSPGAWLVTLLPPLPIAKALQLITVGLLVLAAGVGAVRTRLPGRTMLIALGALGASVMVSLFVGGSVPQVVLYDLYGNMSLLQWLAFPAAFLVAASIVIDRERLGAGLITVVAIGAVLAAVMAFQQVTVSTPRVFGSTGYSTTALVPLIPVGVALAWSRRGALRVLLYGSVLVIAVAVGALSGAMMGAVAITFTLLATVAAHLWTSERGGRVGSAVRWVALTGVGAMLVGLLVVQIFSPANRVMTDLLSDSGTSVVSRAQMWQGAASMFLERPLFGYGPSGYRVAAVNHLPAEALQYGPDLPGNVDPTVYSPQSPHALVWEIATRLGLAGVLAFGFLLLAWVRTLIARFRDETGGASMRLALAAGFVSALFALMVNPAYFAIGLFVPVAAGLAVAPGASVSQRRADKPSAQARPQIRWPMVCAGLAVMLVALWLGSGEWRAYHAGSDDPYLAVSSYESALQAVPGHPTTHRRLLEYRLLVAPDDTEVAAVQAQVDAAPRHLLEFAPNAVSLVTFALTQAEVTGRTDLSWEDRILTDAEAVLPPIPSLVAERLRLTLIADDRQALPKALADAERWGRPYPANEEYVARARQLLGQQ